MSSKKKYSQWPLSCKAGIFVILIYTICTIISWILFPGSYSPFDNMLSDLGNYGWNPIGAYFYNFGCIITGIALILFFKGLKEWYPEDEKNKKLIVKAQVIGLCSAVSLIMAGIFSEDFGLIHSIWGVIYVFLNLILLIIASLAIYRYEDPKVEIHFKFGGLIGFIVAAVNISLVIYFVIYRSGAILEWATVFFSLGFVGLIVYFGRYISSD